MEWPELADAKGGGLLLSALREGVVGIQGPAARLGGGGLEHGRVNL